MNEEFKLQNSNCKIGGFLNFACAYADRVSPIALAMAQALAQAFHHFEWKCLFTAPDS